MTPHAYTPAPGTSVSLSNELPDLPHEVPRLRMRALFGHAAHPWRFVTRRFRGVAVGVLVLGSLDCSRGARAVRLPSPEADAFIYQIDCHTNIESCRKKAAELCPIGYDVLESTGAKIEPARVDTEPGPRSTASRYQRPDWAGQIIVACGNSNDAAAGARRAAGEDTAPVAAGAPAREVRSPGPDQLCVPGVTQLCLGPGACRGAQPCLADGRGYGACDCGAVGMSSSTGHARQTGTADAGISQP